MVCVWAGKGFPDMRQNERTEFIRVGDAVRRVAASRQSQCFGGLEPISFITARQRKLLLKDGIRQWDRGL